VVQPSGSLAYLARPDAGAATALEYGGAVASSVSESDELGAHSESELQTFSLLAERGGCAAKQRQRGQVRALDASQCRSTAKRGTQTRWPHWGWEGYGYYMTPQNSGVACAVAGAFLRTQPAPAARLCPWSVVGACWCACSVVCAAASSSAPWTRSCVVHTGQCWISPHAGSVTTRTVGSALRAATENTGGHWSSSRLWHQRG
jgi:hypothetical protein